MKNLMEARDSVSGSLAECYVTLTGRRYCLMQLTEFESKWGITLTDVPILGRVQKGKNRQERWEHGQRKRITTSRCSEHGFCIIIRRE